MQPDDILVLLKIAVIESSEWTPYQLSLDLGYSEELIIESLVRLEKAGHLKDGRPDQSRLKKLILEDVPEKFPATPGKLTKGMYTGFSAQAGFSFGVARPSTWVWPKEDGQDWGQEILPLSGQCCFAVLQDRKLRDVLSIVETLRVKGDDAKVWAEVLLRQNGLF